MAEDSVTTKVPSDGYIFIFYLPETEGFGAFGERIPNSTAAITSVLDGKFDAVQFGRELKGRIHGAVQVQMNRRRLLQELSWMALSGSLAVNQISDDE